jgi:hypothetical protein
MIKLAKVYGVFKAACVDTVFSFCELRTERVG